MRWMFILALIVLPLALLAQERVDLSVPETKSNTSYHVQRLTLDLDASTIMVELKGVNGEALTKIYNQNSTPTGAALLSSLNVSNNSAGTSLIKRVYNRLLADGVVAGMVSGTPQ